MQGETGSPMREGTRSLPEPCRIIGVLDNGADGLTPLALTHLRNADLVIGGRRTLRLFADEIKTGAQTRDLSGRLSQVAGWVREARAEGLGVAILATGDPLCHGIAGYLRPRMDAESCEVIPNLSCVQLACARLGWAWQDLRILSVHHRDAGEWYEGAGTDHGLYPVLRAAETCDRLAILTSPENSPGRIARMLVRAGLGDDLRMTVAERLTRDDERVVPDRSLAEAAGQRYAEPNVVLLRRAAPPRLGVLFGLADEDFAKRHPGKGLITRREVRAVSLARMQLKRDSVVWDIGAGSGALGLEAARLCSEGCVYAIEKDAEDVEIAARNRRRLGVRNYVLVQGRAPAGLNDWPDPDAVFIGGSGGELETLIRLSLVRLRDDGVLVMNVITLENLLEAVTTLEGCGATWDLTQVQASRSRPILDMHRLAAENPVWILCARVAER